MGQEQQRTLELFVKHLSEVFTPHENTQDPKVEREITTYTQPENTQAFILHEIQNEIK
jgi:hypothetical protein